MSQSFDPQAFTVQSKQSWSAVAEPYDKISAGLFPPITAAFLSFLQLRPGQFVLDVACGSGALATGAAAAVGPSGKVLGVDLSPGMLKLAMGRATAQNLEYREMNAEALDLPEELFDAVACQLGLMLFARPRAALKEMARVCKRGGSVGCLVQGSPERMLFTSLLMKPLLKQAPELKQQGAPSLYAFAPEGILEQALAQEGLTRIVSTRLSGTFTFQTPRDYLATLKEGAGRSGSLLRGLPEAKRRAVEEETLAAAAQYADGDAIAIPYEVVMAKGFKLTDR